MPNSPGGGLALELTQPHRPALRVEVAGHGRLVLRQNDTVVLTAQIDPHLYGVDYSLTGRFRPPIPPIRAARAAAIGADDPGPVRLARWAHHFATALTDADGGPLHTGRWVISPEVPPQRWASLLLPAERGWIDWFAGNGTWSILPLRPLDSSDSGRVKSYRKQARAGTLAPVLLWWISGLDCYVVLDGHDRLAAALAEDRVPPLLALSSVSAHRVARDREAALNRYTGSVDALGRQVAAGVPGSVEALAAVNRRLGEHLRAIETHYGTTRAWPLRDQ
jgi:hypothetical protein